jgi:hypothetical protein
MIRLTHAVTFPPARGGDHRGVGYRCEGFGSPFGVYFQNTPGRVGRFAARRLLDRLTKSYDVGAHAEAGHLTRRGTLRALNNRRDNRWESFAGEGVGNLASTPILWRAARFDFVMALPIRHFEDTRVGSWGAGPPVMFTGHTNAVILRDRRTGRLHGFAVGHWVPSVTQQRPPGGDALTSWRKRRELHRLETEGAVWLARLGQSIAFPDGIAGNVGDVERVSSWHMLGDFNAGDDHALLADLRASHPHRVFPGPTLHGRRIDGAFVWAERPR